MTTETRILKVNLSRRNSATKTIYHSSIRSAKIEARDETSSFQRCPRRPPTNMRQEGLRMKKRGGRNYILALDEKYAVKRTLVCPSWFGAVVTAPACSLKGHGSDSSQGHVPQLQAPFLAPVGAPAVGNRWTRLSRISVSLSPSLPLPSAVSRKSMEKIFPGDD